MYNIILGGIKMFENVNTHINELFYINVKKECENLSSSIAQEISKLSDMYFNPYAYDKYNIHRQKMDLILIKQFVDNSLSDLLFSCDHHRNNGELSLLGEITLRVEDLIRRSINHMDKVCDFKKSYYEHSNIALSKAISNYLKHLNYISNK